MSHYVKVKQPYTGKKLNLQKAEPFEVQMSEEKEENNSIWTTELYCILEIMTMKNSWHEGFNVR